MRLATTKAGLDIVCPSKCIGNSRAMSGRFCAELNPEMYCTHQQRSDVSQDSVRSLRLCCCCAMYGVSGHRKCPCAAGTRKLPHFKKEFVDCNSQGWLYKTTPKKKNVLDNLIIHFFFFLTTDVGICKHDSTIQSISQGYR